MAYRNKWQGTLTIETNPINSVSRVKKKAHDPICRIGVFLSQYDLEVLPSPPPPSFEDIGQSTFLSQYDLEVLPSATPLPSFEDIVYSTLDQILQVCEKGCVLSWVYWRYDNVCIPFLPPNLYNRFNPKQGAYAIISSSIKNIDPSEPQLVATLSTLRKLTLDLIKGTQNLKSSIIAPEIKTDGYLWEAFICQPKMQCVNNQIDLNLILLYLEKITSIWGVNLKIFIRFDPSFGVVSFKYATHLKCFHDMLNKLQVCCPSVQFFLKQPIGC
jgi:hypothetical protein